MKPLTNHSQSSNSPIPSTQANQPQSSSQGFSLVSKRTIFEESSFEVYEHCVIFRPYHPPVHEYNFPQTTRSRISEFSKRSRFRLFTAMAKINDHLVNKPFFVTLTYHYGHTRPGNSTKSNLHSFLVSLRDFDINVQFIWRIEYQKRGAPHYHLFIFPDNHQKIKNRKAYLVKVAEIWHRIADPDSQAHSEYGCKLIEIDNYRKACAYLSKYLAKVPTDGYLLQYGKHWGCSRNLPCKPVVVIPSNLDHDKWLIEQLRKWLTKHGKSEYATSEYFNIHRPQVIFIDPTEFLRLADREDLIAGDS